MMRKRSPNRVPGTKRPSSEESHEEGDDEIGRVRCTSVGISEAGEAAESGVAQEPQNRLVSGLSARQRLHVMKIGDGGYCH